jgi:hypothetical protein
MLSFLRYPISPGNLAACRILASKSRQHSRHSYSEDVDCSKGRVRDCVSVQHEAAVTATSSRPRASSAAWRLGCRMAFSLRYVVEGWFCRREMKRLLRSRVASHTRHLSGKLPRHRRWWLMQSYRKIVTFLHLAAGGLGIAAGVLLTARFHKCPTPRAST